MPRFIRQRGTIDIYDVEARLYQKVLNACQKQANLFNYNPITTPTFESTSLYTRSTGETSDIVTKEMWKQIQAMRKKSIFAVIAKMIITSGVK